MHNLNVLIIGSKNFFSALNEIKSHLNFNLFFYDKLSNLIPNNIQVMILHEVNVKDVKNSTFLEKSKIVKILATKKMIKDDMFSAVIKLPASINELNNIVETSLAKRKFYDNSSIKIKEYLLNKNERKLTKENFTLILTEKEIKLLELLLNERNPISKKKILSLVWEYSKDADTHTVETHIYRLRKKINEIFKDDKFILNNKDGYHL
tara:strand:+ start:549 stop:1169 length:621 start_codon:yes stop_codon:yes gene_type:complete